MKKIFFLFILTANLLNSNAQSVGMSVGISNDPNNTNCDEFIKKEIILMQEFLEIGQIVNTFGIKGMVKVKPFTDDITRFDNLEKVYVESNKTKKQYEIEEVKYHKDMVLIKFKGIDRVEDAELLRNSYLKVNRQDEPELEEGTYYIVDLIGLDVYSDESKLLGKLDDVFNSGSCDIYVVKDELGKQLLLPAISDVIKEINLEEKKIVAHLLKGLV